MSYDTPTAPTLFELLARSWTLDRPVIAAVFNAEATSVAFCTGDSLGIAPLADPEDPAGRMRLAADTGRATIHPRRAPARPLARVAGTRGPVVPWGGKSFLTGAAAGGLISVTPRGQTVPLGLRLPGALDAAARDPASLEVALAAGGALIVLPDELEASPLHPTPPGPVTALAYAPRGGLLAVGHAGGVSLWRDGWRATHALEAGPTRLAFSPDGAWLAAAFEQPGVALIDLVRGEVDPIRDYPTPAASVAWSGPATNMIGGPATATGGTAATGPRRDAGAVLVTSGAFRVAAWAIGADGRGDSLGAGRTGLVIVDRVATSPDRPLVASGYANGLVAVAQLGLRDEMLLRAEGGAVTALAWAPGGGPLALGDAQGAAACIAFPPGLFK